MTTFRYPDADVTAETFEDVPEGLQRAEAIYLFVVANCLRSVIRSSGDVTFPLVSRRLLPLTLVEGDDAAGEDADEQTSDDHRARALDGEADRQHDERPDHEGDDDRQIAAQEPHPRIVARTAASEAAQEARKAFFEKRDPVFYGK